jgi:hypothetical protein
LLTSGALSLIAFMAADLSHEVLGHGSVALLAHAKFIALSYTALSTDISSRMLLLAGPGVNLILGIAGLVIFRALQMKPRMAWFLFLFASMSLLNLSAYLILSGATATGDLAGAIVGLPHPAIIRSCMGIAGLISYYLLVRVSARSFRQFAEPNTGLCVTAYLAPMVLNTAAASLSPLGLHYYLFSALPATAGVNIFLLILPGVAERVQRDTKTEAPRAVVARSIPWILMACVLGIAYVFLLGPGVTLRS